MKYILLLLFTVVNSREIDNVYNMIKSDSGIWDGYLQEYVDFLYSRTNGTIYNCFDDRPMAEMDLLSESKTDYLNYLESVNNTQILCTRNLQLVKFKEMEKFKFRFNKELGLIWGRKEHVRCGGRDLSNLILRCIAMEYIKK